MLLTRALVTPRLLASRSLAAGAVSATAVGLRGSQRHFSIYNPFGKSNKASEVAENVKASTETTLESAKDSIESVAGAASADLPSIQTAMSPVMDAASNASESIASTAQAAATAISPDQIGYFQSIGLAESWFWPSGIFQHIFEYAHVTTGLPWWASIALVTIGMRTVMFPLYMKASHQTAKMSAIKPELNELVQQYNDATDPLEGQRLLLKRKQLLAKHGIKTSHMLMPMLGFPFFIGIFNGLNGMARAPVEGLLEGGILWFQNLAAKDPYLGLQAFTACVYSLTFRMGGESGATNLSPGMKKLFMYLPFVAIPATMGIPAATCYYFAINSLLSISQTLLIKNASFRKATGMAPLVAPPPETGDVSAWGSIKKTLDNAKKKAEKAAEDQEREQKLRMKAKKEAESEFVTIKRSSISDANRGKTVKKGDALRG